MKRAEIDKYIENRVLKVVEYMIKNKSTIRETARKFGVSKYTIYTDATIRILEIDPQKALEVEKVILFNKRQRHIRGGEVIKRRALITREMTRQAF